jgi:hypothetical protein
MAEKETTERRVYNLPADLLERLRAFQTENGITSEVEAVRRLLDSALQMRDTIENILDSLKARFADERDLRVLASDVLIKHALINSVQIGEGELTFSLSTGERGRMVNNGALYLQGPEERHDDWSSYSKAEKTTRPKPKAASSGWDAGWDAGGGMGGGDLDDEIPF